MGQTMSGQSSGGSDLMGQTMSGQSSGGSELQRPHGSDNVWAVKWRV